MIYSLECGRVNSSPRDDVNDRSSCDGDSSYCRLAALQCDDVGNDFISSMLRFMCRLDIAFVYALNKFRIYAVLIEVLKIHLPLFR